MKKIGYCILIFILIGSFSTELYAQNDENTEIVVGYCVSDMFIQRQAGGEYGGYGVEYLNEIAEMTGWKYKFISGTKAQCLERLESGEVDLVGNLGYSREWDEKYEYTQMSCGELELLCFTSANNEEICYEDFESFHGLKIGMINDSVHYEKWKEFEAEHGIQTECILYNTKEELKSALTFKNIDAVVSTSIGYFTEEKLIAKVANIPIFFVVANGKKNILNQFNDALNKIKFEDINFNVHLFDKYLKNNLPNIAFTKKEKNFIEASPEIRVVGNPNAEPIEYFDVETGEFKGVYAAFIKLFEEKSGLKFKYIRTSSYQRSLQMIRNGEADLIANVYKDDILKESYSMELSESYYEADLVIIGRNGMSFDDEKYLKVAVDKNYIGLNYFVKAQYPYWRIVFYEGTKECIDAIQNQEVDISVMNSSVASNFLQGNYYYDIALISSAVNKMLVSVGISDKAPEELSSIINKTIYNVSEKEKNNIVLKNAISEPYKTSLLTYISGNAVFIISLSLISAFFIIVIIMILNYKKQKELLKLSETDKLTGIYNKITAENRIQECLKEITGVNAIYIIDIDCFKNVNDNFGHQFGDFVITETANVLKEVFSQEDILGRIGGDEFIVMQRMCTEEQIRQRASLLLQKLERKHYVEKEGQKIECHISCSIGIVLINLEKKAKYEALAKKADEALYAVKKSGRNNYRIVRGDN